MPRSIDPVAQARRKKEAKQSAMISSLWLLGSGGLVLFLRYFYHITGFWGAVLLIFAVLDLGMIIPVWILLKTRLKEIEGGEEDAAAQY